MMARRHKRKVGTQNPNPPKQLIAKNPPTGLLAIGDVLTTTVAEVSPSQEPLGLVLSTAFPSFPLNATPSIVPDVVGMDVDFSTPQVSAPGLATGGQPGPSFQASSSVSHELPTSLIQSHETTLTADFPPGPPSVYPISGTTPPMSEKGKAREDNRERFIQEFSGSINQSLSAVEQVASSNDGFRRLNCLVEGDSVVFTVITPSSSNISQLKELIQKKRELGVLKDVDPHTLDLWKVDVDLNAQTRDSLRRLKLEPRGEELVEWNSVSRYWSLQPADKKLHIFVKPQADAGNQRPAKRFRSSDPFDEENLVVGGKLFKHTPSKPLAEVKESTNQILERYRPRMRELVADARKTPLPPWIPKTRSGDQTETAYRDYIKSLAIPIVEGRPSLLLHDLGVQESIMNEKQAEHIADVFSLSTHIVLINTPGSGKTRLGLQGLCQHWGFYAVVARGQDGIGSSDFSELMESLDNSLDYDRTKSIESYNEAVANHMNEKARHRLLQFLLARFLLLNLLIEEAGKCGGLRPANHRLLWVLLQAQPTQMIDGDAFREVADALWIASTEDLKKEIRDEYFKLKPILEFVEHQHRPLYFFLDEIQLTTTLRMGQFWADDKKTKWPLLRPIWLTMTTIFDSLEMRFILSGTAIDSTSIQQILGSSALKLCPYKFKKDIGAFDDPDVQRQYVKHYLPNVGDAFLERVWGWCRGRYRSTATLITLILETGHRSPHKILDKYVERSTKFKPTDGREWTADEPELCNFDIPILMGWNFWRMNRQQITTLCDVLYHQIVYGQYSLIPFAPEDEIESFIEYGFARTRSDDHVIDEPLVIMAAWDWLDQNGHFKIFNCLQRGIGKHAPRKNGFEAYLAFYMRKVFERTPRLDDVFIFRSDFARRKSTDLSWLKEEFELVTVSSAASTNQWDVSVVTPLCGPSSNVGFLAPTDEDVLSWISENRECYAFCFPTETAGPDLFFFVRSKTTQSLLLVAVQAKHYEEVKKQSLVQGVRAVTPSWFWKGKATKNQSVDEVQPLSSHASNIASCFYDALMKVEPAITIMNAPHPVLRIFASWPADAKIERTLDCKNSTKKGKAKSQAKVDEDSVDIDSDGHPLAMLHLENFNNIGKILGESWFMDDVEQKEVVFAKRFYNNKEKV